MATVALIGAGGNIGSHAAPLLARLPEVDELLLVDPDVYAASNLRTQAIEPGDVGRAKVEVLAERVQRIGVHARAFAEPIEGLPAGRFGGCAAIAAGLDRNSARQHVNSLAWRLGVPLVDAGVDAGSALARVNVYVPGADDACLECAWSDEDYVRLEQVMPCRGEASVTATNAPAHLGALAASLLCAETEAVLRGNRDMAGRQFIVGAGLHVAFDTRYARRSGCRFDHHAWCIEPLPLATSIGRLAMLFEAAALAVLGAEFASALACLDCGRVVEGVRVVRGAAMGRCTTCSGRLAAPAFDRHESLPLAATLAGVYRDASLADLGLVAGDIVTVQAAGTPERHLQLIGEEENEQ